MYEKVDNKYITHKSNDVEGGLVSEQCVTNEYYNHNRRLSKFGLIMAVLLNRKGFCWKLNNSIKYALIHHMSYCGQNASDVLLLEAHEDLDKIWKKKKKFNSEGKDGI